MVDVIACVCARVCGLFHVLAHDFNSHFLFDARRILTFFITERDLAEIVGVSGDPPVSSCRPVCPASHTSALRTS